MGRLMSSLLYEIVLSQTSRVNSINVDATKSCTHWRLKLWFRFRRWTCAILICVRHADLGFNFGGRAVYKSVNIVGKCNEMQRRHYNIVTQ